MPAPPELGYLPNMLARSLLTRETSAIGVLVPDVSNPGERGISVVLPTEPRVRETTAPPPAARRARLAITTGKRS